MNSEKLDDIDLLLKAATFAAHKHSKGRRKDADASPYINHPLALASVLKHEGNISDIIVLCAALLHDTIEETETSAEELQSRFGPDITAIVLEVTDDKSLPKAERKQRQVEHAAHISERAKLVKLADKICNLRDILNSPPADWPLSRKQEYFDWAKRVIDQLRGVHSVLERLFDEAYAMRPKA